MGLDIYLYPTATAEANALHYSLYDRDDYDELTDEFKAQWNEDHPYVRDEDVPSERYPDHLFNRRYLRSSYNGGGFNRAVPDFVGADHDLYWIFEPMGRQWDGDEGTLTEEDVPALRECRKRAEQVTDELRQCDPIRVMAQGGMTGWREHMWHQPPTEDEALAWYREEKAKHAGDDKADPWFSDGGYSTAKGLVLGFEKGIEVLAVTVGSDCLGSPAALLVYRPDSDAIDSYVQSAEITAEFIDEAISLIERDGSANLSWSG